MNGNFALSVVLGSLCSFDRYLPWRGYYFSHGVHPGNPSYEPSHGPRTTLASLWKFFSHLSVLLLLHHKIAATHDIGIAEPNVVWPYLANQCSELLRRPWLETATEKLLEISFLFPATFLGTFFFPPRRKSFMVFAQDSLYICTLSLWHQVMIKLKHNNRSWLPNSCPYRWQCHKKGLSTESIYGLK